MPITPHPDSPSDQPSRLAERAQAGDRAAFEQLILRFEPGLKRLLLRRAGGRSELVEEIIHETWIAVWEALVGGRYDPTRAAISTFIYAIAHKRWLQHLRRSAYRPTPVGDIEALLGESDGTDNPAHLLQAGELLEAMRGCLHASTTPHSLTAEERQVVIGLSGEESERSLAGLLELAPSTIHARKLSAHNKLRRCLAAKGFSAESHERGLQPRE